MSIFHKGLGTPWHCPKDQRFDEVMADIGAVLQATGWAFGRTLTTLGVAL